MFINNFVIFFQFLILFFLQFGYVLSILDIDLCFVAMKNVLKFARMKSKR